MDIKGEDRSFIIDEKMAHESPDNKENYRFIHPNFDDYFEHIQFDVVIRNAKSLIKYTVLNGSDKGTFTRKYFELEKIEMDTFNEAQGVKTGVKNYSDMIPIQEVKNIEALIGRA